MYTDRKRRRWVLPVILAAVLLVCVLLFLQVKHRSSGDLTEESTAALQEAIRRTARQCYAVEGCYPPSLSYMEENYGLRINTDDYYVVYDAYASNQPPDIRVVPKTE